MATTLVLFVLVYGVVGSLGLYYINRLIARGPQPSASEPRITAAPTLAPHAGALAGIKPSSTPMSE
jgi:cytochrome d ubiquinol oxidase subunit I